MSEAALPIGIRPARADDVRAIEDLHRASVRELAVGYYAPGELDRFLATRRLDRELIDAGTYFLAEIAGLLVGSGGWMAVGNGPDGGPVARIRSVFVHPDWARRGIGRRLVLHAESDGARAGFTRFDLESSLPGVPLYRHLGYRAVRSYGLALPDGTTLPVVRMEKELTFAALLEACAT